MKMLRSWAGLLLCALASVAQGANDAPLPADAASAPAPVSLSARKVYEQARSQLLQIRTVLKGRASQTSVGSGFLVSKEGHIVTNFHVVSEVALKPERTTWST
jgi:S1-C subfamily serine protease